jgi:hypothetical protein
MTPRTNIHRWLTALLVLGCLAAACAAAPVSAERVGDKQGKGKKKPAPEEIAPAPAPVSDPIADAIDALWKRYGELRRAGRIDNDLVLVFPPLRNDRRMTELSEDLVARIQSTAPDGATLISGAELAALMDEHVVGTRAYQDVASAKDIGALVQAGFVVAGNASLEQDSSNYKAVRVRLCGGRSLERGLDFDSGNVDIVRGKSETFAKLQLLAERVDSLGVPFGGTPGATEIALDDDAKRRLLTLVIERSLDQFTRRLDAEAPAAVAQRATILLPTLDADGEPCGLADTLDQQWRKLFVGAPRLSELEKRGREANVPFAALADSDPELALVRRLGATAVLQTRASYDDVARELTLEIGYYPVDGQPVFDARTTRLRELGQLVAAMNASSAKLVFPNYSIDAQTLARDLLTERCVELLAKHAGTLAAQRVRLLPVETPRTAQVSAVMNRLRSELLDAEEQLAKQAALAHHDLDAVKAGRIAGYPVRIPALQLEFACFDEAREVVAETSWRLTLSGSAQWGKTISDALRSTFTERGVALQSMPEELAQLGALSGDTFSPKPRLQDRKLELPDFVIAPRIELLGETLILSVRVLDYRGDTKEAPGDVSRREYRGALADALARALPTETGPDAANRLLREIFGAVGSVPAPKPPAAVQVVVLHDGRKMAELARDLVVELDAPYDGGVQQAFSDWKSIAPPVREHAAELRYVKGDAASEAEARTLLDVLRSGRGLSRRVAAEVARLPLELVAQPQPSGPNSPREAESKADAPHVVIVLRD